MRQVWLPIRARIQFKMMTFMYNCSRGNAPAYLTELLTKSKPTRVLRSASNAAITYAVPFNKRKTFSDRGFRTAGPALWDKLPIDIREAETLDLFKKKLKTHYFRDFYSFF